ncbi:MAG: hypothetical protein DWH91_16065 [Planctomycetota bacterium]|nr:MAG: hypothetical protein DWH91_16065 [Planctomycetota bacterium]
MNCGEAQQELALWVGQDLTDPVRIETLRRHVAICPVCGQRAKALKASLVALGSLEVPQTYDTIDSLWPEVEARIMARQSQPPMRSSLVIWAALGLLSLVILGGTAWMWRTTPPSAAPAVTPNEPVAPPLYPPSPGHQSSGISPAIP